MAYEIATGTNSRYELRSSQHGITPEVWMAVIQANGGWNVRKMAKGSATVIYFDAHDAERIRRAVRAVLGTRNFAVRHRPRWKPTKPTQAA